jgi:hypothetical protein
MERVKQEWRELIKRRGISIPWLWKKVLKLVGKDPIATLVYLYYDELASNVGWKAEDYTDPGDIYVDLSRELGDETGEWDPDIAEKAWREALRKYAMMYRDKLGALGKEELEITLDLTDVLEGSL